MEKTEESLQQRFKENLWQSYNIFLVAYLFGMEQQSFPQAAQKRRAGDVLSDRQFCQQILLIQKRHMFDGWFKELIR